MDEKQLKVMLMFGSDASKAEAGLAALLQRFKQLEQRANELRQSLKVFRSTQQDTAALEKELNAVEQEMRQISDAARKAQSELKGMSKGAQDARDNLYNLRDIGQKLSQVGSQLSGLGNAITSPLMNASAVFLQTVNQTNPLAMQWRTEMSSIQDSWLRIGRVATEELLPVLHTAAEFVDKLADFVEANPEVVKLALGTGLILKGTGEGLQALGGLAMLTGALKQFGLFGSAIATAGGTAVSIAVIAPIVATTLSVLAGVGIGAAVYDKLVAPATGGAKLNQFATVGAYWFGQAAGNISTALGLMSPEEAQRKTDVLTAIIGKITGAIDENSPIWQRAQAAMLETNNREEIITQSQLDAFAEFEKAQQRRQQHERQSEETRNAIVAEFGARRAELEQSYESQRANIITQYARQRAQMMSAFSLSESRAEQDYYRQRMTAARNHGVEVRRMEEDHQREMRKLQRDHNRRVRDLVDERDALGLVREQRAYEDQRREAEQDYRIQAARRSEDFARQLQEMDANFAVQRQRRLEDFQRQMQEMAILEQERLAQLDAQHALEMQKLAEQEKARLEQFDKNYKAELEQLRSAEQQRLNILRSLALNDQAALQRAGMELTVRYRAWLQQATQGFLTTPTGSISGRANGGWVNANTPYWVGERGPELLIPHSSGTVIPTHRILSSRGDGAGGSTPGSVNMRIETSSLTLSQVVREIDKRLTRNNRALAEAFA